MEVKVNKKEILKQLDQLMQAFEDGRIPRLEVHEIHPDLNKGSRLNYIYFTLPVAINFQRNSPAMWASAFKTFEDPETNYVFYPEKVVDVSFEKLQADLMKHKLALQRNKHVQIWQTISQTLFDEYNSDPREIFKANQRCVTRTKNCLVENKKSFPYLSGPKLSNYWLFILDHFTDIELRNKHKISIIPDTHIKQASAKLGVTDSTDPKVVEEAWFELLKGTKYTPIDLHSMLWHWSRSGFNEY